MACQGAVPTVRRRLPQRQITRSRFAIKVQPYELGQNWIILTKKMGMGSVDGKRQYIHTIYIYIYIPAGNQTWQWKIHHLQLDFPNYKAPFSSGTSHEDALMKAHR